VEQNPGNDYFEGCLAFALLRAGRAPEAVSLREKLERAKASAMALAVAYAGERRVDDAVRQLEIAYERRDPRLAALAVEPLLGELRGHKSFVALLEKLNLR
jgi:CO/xanthine dehydrogenase Mo-binding subunit